jgi:hypothetical protein
MDGAAEFQPIEKGIPAGRFPAWLVIQDHRLQAIGGGNGGREIGLVENRQADPAQAGRERVGEKHHGARPGADFTERHFLYSTGALPP